MTEGDLFYFYYGKSGQSHPEIYNIEAKQQNDSTLTLILLHYGPEFRENLRGQTRVKDAAILS